MNVFVPAGRAEAMKRWADKIGSFSGTIEYDRTGSPSYMEETAKAALRHFGFECDVRVRKECGICSTTYTMYVDGHEVSGYRTYGNPSFSDSEKIGANLKGMVEEAIMCKMGKDGEALENVVGGIEGIARRWGWIGPGGEA